MKVGIITGTGTYVLPGLEAGSRKPVRTRFGEALMMSGSVGDVEVLHISRHEEGHRLLSSQVTHRANIAALKELGADCVLAVTVCGAVDPTLPLGSLVVFDDLHFLANRLPDGSLCSFYDQPGDPQRGHWIYEGPFSADMRAVLLESCRDAGVQARDGGCYGHVDGPRFNTRAEIRTLAAAGVSAVSQTAGPETVLCGEAELPYGLLGYATDYANGVQEEPTPVAELLRLIDASKDVFAQVLEAALPNLAGRTPAPRERCTGSMDLRDLIRDVPDFPKPGIVFKDITPLLLEPRAFDAAVHALADYARPLDVELIVAAEARGFIFGGALARELDVGFVPARKPGKLPSETVSVQYGLEYGVDTLELHADAVRGGTRVLIHDDVLATGGTAKAKIDLVEQLGGRVAGCAFVVELAFLNARELLAGYDVHALVSYES